MSDKAYGTGDAAQIRLEIVSTESGMSTVEVNGGVDVVLYKVPRPVAFLQRQRNLHRISTDLPAREEGLRNTLAHLWDRWFRATRMAWRAIFTAAVRKETVKQAPALATAEGFNAPTRFTHAPQYRALPGFDLVTRFRYPVHRAQPIGPPKGVKLAGSSSEFIIDSPGNVMIPLGKLQPALYLVEATVGSHRATSLLFVSDTMAITKTSAREMFVWTVNRTNGMPVRGASVTWTDGAGILKSGSTDAQGIARYDRETPERSYVFGEDPNGGVFISENFYYDSEIYDTKIYATTDRPLYRPGDQVFVKLFARAFESARDSRPAAADTVTLETYDPGGAPIVHQRLRLDPLSGGDTSFRLPENSTAGGYELRMTYRDAQYSSAFRVAEYQKPHFEITVVPDKPDFKSGETVSGRLQLHYPDGKPVRADISLTVRSQTLTTVDGELRYYGEFPVKLEEETLTTDARGEARFSLPPASEPSRFLLTVTATDGAAYRVKTTKELLVERSQSSFAMRAEPQFTGPNDAVTFSIAPVRRSLGEDGLPVSWDWVRLENRQRAQGRLDNPDRLTITFSEPGSYTVNLRDARGNIVAACPHWVSGPGTRPPTGTIDIVPSKERYAPGDLADLLITFPEPVDEALLTLERDKVESAVPLTRARDWVRVTRLGPEQWRAQVPVRAAYAPNITFSVVYVKHGEYVFQNQGLTVTQPIVDVSLTTNKDVYQPGDVVDVQVKTTVSGRPVPAVLAVGVVDEMIYALQPEIAPDINDFFFHARRNNVRTTASQDFLSYDLSAPRSKRAVEPRSVNERRVKVLERPRRDEVDTAFWQPTIRTDNSGTARFTFTMPDSLTRWRLTARGVARDGTVGQRVAFVRSDKDLYGKWTSPTWTRVGDAPVATVAVFNQTPTPQRADVEITGPGLTNTRTVTLQPGVNFLEQTLQGANGSGTIGLTIRRNSVVIDRLETPLTATPTAWSSEHTQFLNANEAATRLELPRDARDIRVTFTSSAAAEFSRVADDLMEYPYGCIEQTASRMIPFALAIESLPATEVRIRERLTAQLSGQRLRLAYMADPKGLFSWWGRLTHDDPFLTAYAYYADWIASRTMGLALPADHWNRLLDVYRENGEDLPLPHRALFLHFMQEMKLPTRSLIEGTIADVRGARPRLTGGPVRHAIDDGLLLGDSDEPVVQAIAMVVLDRIARAERVAVPADLTPIVDASYDLLQATNEPLSRALLVATGRLDRNEAGTILSGVRAEMPTFERSLTLAWLRGSLGTAPTGPAPALRAPWTRSTTATGATVWRLAAGSTVPTSLALSQPAPVGMRAVVQYTSAAAASPSLAVGLQRRLYRVVKRDGEEGYTLQQLANNAPLSTSELYLDEILVTPGASSVRFAALEVPLPPGASVDSTTWGIGFPASEREPDRDEEKLEGLEASRHETTRFGYVVPVDDIDEPTRIRHLVRFSQKGSFAMPRARLYRMYQPAAKAVEQGQGVRRMDVR